MTIRVDGNDGIWMPTVTVMVTVLPDCAGAVVIDWYASLAITRNASARQGSS